MTLSEIYRYVFLNENLPLCASQIQKVEQSYEFLKSFSQDKIIYGINTGFGPMAQYRVDEEARESLQYNIIRSHSCGMGAALSHKEVKAAMIARLCTFLNGNSGVHTDYIQTLHAFINHNITPFVPEHGSVGASGDLVQLAHLALTLIGEGEVFYQGELRPSLEVMQQLGIKPAKIYQRDGLAVCNGTAFMTGIGVVNLVHAKKLLQYAVKASLLMNEIASSYDDFMSEKLNAVKNHKGQIEIARQMRELALDSNRLLNRDAILYKKHEEKTFGHKVQPYYSLRCVPQILGPVYDAIAMCETILMEELNGVDDNPIIDCEAETVLHGGNFHGDYVSFEMDKLKIAVTKMTMLMERQMNYLFHDKINEILPPFVNLGKLGLNYGMQALQFTATSTTSECQTLSNSQYVHSIPNNNDNQDVVSMGTNSALIARRVIDNAFQVMSIHLLGLAQAVDCLEIKNDLASETQKLYQEIRAIVPTFTDDTPKYKELELIKQQLQSYD